MVNENKIRKLVIAELDKLFNRLADCEFQDLKKNTQLTSEEMDEIESIFMSYRNVIAGTEWDGENREYEAYEVREDDY